MTGLDFFKWVLPPPQKNTWVVISRLGYNKDNPMRDYRIEYTGTEVLRAKVDELKQGEYKGIYYTPATYSSPSNPDKTNRTVRGCDDQLHTLQVLFADIDIDPTGTNPKKYKDIEEAAAGLRKFRETSGWPKPTALVHTGHGLHVYWRLETAIGVDLWRARANKLKELFRREGVLIDAGVTGDPHRLLRVPGTMNNKEPAAPCRMVDPRGLPLVADSAAMAKALSGIELGPDRIPEDVMGDIRAAYPETNSAAVLTNTDDDYPPTYVEEVVKQCGYMAAVLEDEGAGCDEPMWKHVLGVASACEDGREWAHKLSQGHKQYSQAETDSKFDRCTGKPPKCSTMDSVWSKDGPSPCNKCTHNVTSPAVLGRRSEVTATTIPLPTGIQQDPTLQSITPWPFEIGKDYVSKTVPTGKSKRKIIVFKAAVLSVELHRASTANGKSLSALVVGFIGGSPPMYRSIVLDDYDIESTDLGLKLAGNELHTNDPKNAKEIFVSWIQELNAKGPIVRTSTAFGWRLNDSGRYDGFKIGRDLLQAGKPPVATIVAGGDDKCEQYTPRGDLRVWCNAANLCVASGSVGLACMIATGFAAPLIRFAADGGATVNFRSAATGAGKSTSMRIAQTIWGSIQAINSISDTENAINHQLGVLNNLPCYWDEIRTEHVIEKYVEAAFKLSQGRTKARLGMNAKPQPTLSWRTILVSASNDSLIPSFQEHSMHSPAGMARLLEFEVQETRNSGKGSDFGPAFGVVDRNYGLAGRVYAQHLIENVDAIQSEFLDIRTEFANKLDYDPAYRFWLDTITAMYLGAKLAAKLGLVSFKLQEMRDYLIDSVRLMGQEVFEAGKDVEPPALLAEMLSDFQARTLITEEVKLTRGPPSISEGHILRHPTDDRNPLAVHRDCTGIARIRGQDFNKWCKEYKISGRSLRAGLARHGILTLQSKASLGTGTPYKLLNREHTYLLKNMDGSDAMSKILDTTYPVDA